MVILDERAPAFAGRLFAGHDGLSATYSGGWLKLRTEHMREWLPDLTDPATLGCLLALVREAWGNPDFGTQRVGVLADGSPEWVVRDYLGAAAQVYGAGEAGALVAALEAAPKREVT